MSSNKESENERGSQRHSIIITITINQINLTFFFLIFFAVILSTFLRFQDFNSGLCHKYKEH